MTSRRDFLINSSKALAALAIMGNPMLSIASSASRQQNLLVGIQLYSIRNEMKADPLGSLKKLAQIGYKHVEHANYTDRKFYGYSVKEFKSILQDLGLKMPSSHIWFQLKHWDDKKKDFTDEWKYTVEDAVEMGQEYLVNSWIDPKVRSNDSDLIKLIELFNKAGEFCQSQGINFGYHNEHYEFSKKIGDEYLYDYLLANTDDKLVTQQLDIGNIINGGAKAIDVIKKYPGRFPTLHVKDEIKTANGKLPYESTILGKGVIGVKEVVECAIKEGGSKHLIIDVETAQNIAPLESARLCLMQMKQWGYQSV